MSVLLPQVDHLQSKPAAISPLHKTASTRSTVPDLDSNSTSTTGSSSFATQLKNFLDRTQAKTAAKTHSSKADKRRVSQRHTDPATSMQATVVPVSVPVPSSPTPLSMTAEKPNQLQADKAAVSGEDTAQSGSTAAENRLGSEANASAREKVSNEGSAANLPAGAESTGDPVARRSADESSRAAQDANGASPAADALAASAVSVASSPAMSRLTRHSEESARSQAAIADAADSARVKEAFQNALNSSLGEVPAAASKMEQNSAQHAVATKVFAAQHAQSLHPNKSQTAVSEAGTPASTTRNSGASAGPGSGRGRQGNPSNGADSASKAETTKTLFPGANSSDAESATDSVRTSGDGQPNPPSGTPANAPSQSPVTGNPAAQERGLAAWDSMDARAGRIVNAASLAAQPDHVEMRMDVRTETLGALEIHAVLERGRLGASINAETPEARSILASHLPSLEQSLSERHVHMENIVISNHPPSSASTLAGGSDSQGGGNQGSAGNRRNRPWSPEKISGMPGQSESDAWDSEEPWRRLSVRA